ncbi:hypothetical protein HY501_00560 [Candidatus Woesearchaeota archaeon]|nr:hypothetical protein [Candidatus Woesearchaeota archaeon]
MQKAAISNLEKAVLVTSLLSHHHKQDAYANFGQFGFFLLKEICWEVGGKQTSPYQEARKILEEKKFQDSEPLTDFDKYFYVGLMEKYQAIPNTRLELKALICAHFLKPGQQFNGSCQKTLISALQPEGSLKIKYAFCFAAIIYSVYRIYELL